MEKFANIWFLVATNVSIDHGQDQFCLAGLRLKSIVYLEPSLCLQVLTQY